MTPRERLLNILHGRPFDRPAVLCPGGMMSLAVTEVMQSAGVSWPEAHRDEDAMLRLALAMQEATGFDNIALPFCMTVEAEAYGGEIDLGSATIQPRVRRAMILPDGLGELPKPNFRAGRAGKLLKALRKARHLRPDAALVGNLVGPFSLLGMLADPLQVLRWTRRNPDLLLRHLNIISKDLAQFGRLQKQTGADVICIAEPTATGEILGGHLFREFALPYLNFLCSALRSSSVTIIVHICGDISAIEKELFDLSADAVSFDSMANIVALASRNPPWRVMGNLDAFLLKKGPPEAIRKRCHTLLQGGVRLLAPACGVIPTTPASHLKAMSEATRL